jgi:GT2 family glycosyltransferase
VEIAIVVATVGRPDLLSGLFERLEQQTSRPTYAVFSCTDAADVPPQWAELTRSRSFNCTTLYGTKGTCVQRNRALTWLHERAAFFESGATGNIVIFIDDDFVMRNDWIEHAVREMESDVNAIGLTGALLADGAVNAGYTESDALTILTAGTPLLPDDDWRRRPGAVNSLYGCNMVFRARNIAGITFDEKLPLYGWLEDYDFCARVEPPERLRLADSMIGVHLATKRGRTSGLRFGYSQVANPLYLARKRTMSLRFALKMLAQCVLLNVLKSVSPEPYVDRRGRLIGNLLALADASLHRLDPQRVLSL